MFHPSSILIELDGVKLEGLNRIYFDVIRAGDDFIKMTLLTKEKEFIKVMVRSIYWEGNLLKFECVSLDEKVEESLIEGKPELRLLD